MNQDDNQFKAWFDGLRAVDRAHVPSFDRLWQRARQAQASSTPSTAWRPALAIAAGIWLLVALVISTRSGDDELAGADAPIDFEDTRLVVRRHFRNLTWSAPTDGLLNTNVGIQISDDDT